jgi:hypothetical protein
MAQDAFQDTARLIEEFGVCYTQARRYRQIAAECEDRYLARALAIGSEVRQRLRADDEAVDAVVAELRGLIASCAAAIAAVHASATYRHARRAWEDGRFSDVAAVAPAIFDSVEPYSAPDTVYHAIGVTDPRRGGEHFLPAGYVAERIATLVTAGIAAAEPVPDLGADAAIRAVFLEDDPDAAGSPVTIAVEPQHIGLPTFRLGMAGEVLIYAPNVPAVPRVRCATTVSDEWWAVRPDAYARYVDDLARELAARGVHELVR